MGCACGRGRGPEGWGEKWKIYPSKAAEGSEGPRKVLVILSLNHGVRSNSTRIAPFVDVMVGSTLTGKRPDSESEM